MIKDNWTREERVVAFVFIMVLFATVLFVVFVLVPNVYAPSVSDNTSKPNDIMEAFLVLGDENSQFVMIGDESVLNGYSRIMFFVDRKTGVEYVLIHGELSPRYHANGSLIIHPEYIMEAEI